METVGDRWKADVPFGSMVGAVINRIAFLKHEEVYIDTSAGLFGLYHEQDCCEGVWLEDITGDPTDLIGATVVVAEERTEAGYEDDDYESKTWTFYEIRTDKGDLTLRWCGVSNGFYSESVSMVRAAGIPAAATDTPPVTE